MAHFLQNLLIKEGNGDKGGGIYFIFLPTSQHKRVFYSTFALLGFVMNHNPEASALNQYKAPQALYLQLITIWLESLEMSSQPESRCFFKNA